MRITVSGPDYRGVDHAVKILMDTVKSTDNTARGPIPVPPKELGRSVREFTVTSVNHKLMPALGEVILPGSVSVDISA